MHQKTHYCILRNKRAGAFAGVYVTSQKGSWAFQRWFWIENQPIIKWVMAIFVDKGHSQGNQAGGVHL